jgi:hypothetical protein
MKTLVVLGAKTRTGTPFTTMQVDDFAWADRFAKQDVEARCVDLLRQDYGGTPVRLVWIYQDVPVPLGEQALMALADGAGIPWDILEDRDLSDSGSPGQEPETTEKVPPVRS